VDVVDVNKEEGHHVHNVHGPMHRYADDEDDVAHPQYGHDEFSAIRKQKVAGSVRLEPAKSGDDRVARLERLGLPHAEAVALAGRTKEG